VKIIQNNSWPSDWIFEFILQEGWTEGEESDRKWQCVDWSRSHGYGEYVFLVKLILCRPFWIILYFLYLILFCGKKLEF